MSTKYPRQPRRPRASRRRYTPYQSSTIVAIIAIVAVTGAILAAETSFRFIWTWWIGCSIATWLLYTFDKVQSKTVGKNRIPELVLLGMVIVGGFFGGLVALIFPRHKTRHVQFILVPLFAALMHVGAAMQLGWL